jgi:hypothetical protein
MRKDLDPSVWGRAGWTFLRSCAEASDPSTRSHYHQLFRLLPDVLPCGNCRRHCREYLRHFPPEEAPDLVVWLTDFEEAVRRRKSSPAQSSTSVGVGWILLCLVAVVAVAAAVAHALPPTRAGAFAQM